MTEQDAFPSGKLDAAPAPVTARPPEGAGQFDGNSTAMFQAKMKRAPVWFCSFLAGNSREKLRLRDELALMKGAWPLLMKQRNGGKWTPEEKAQLKAMIRSASSVSPYLFIWALPGSVVLLPFMAWYLDRQRKSRARKQSRP
ncbi:MAG TPA: hypothetical protein VN649_20270 [Ramlibacter sp.]|nr:hypothetical protein [Ramlibacter sp.]